MFLKCNQTQRFFAQNKRLQYTVYYHIKDEAITLVQFISQKCNSNVHNLTEDEDNVSKHVYVRMHARTHAHAHTCLTLTE